MKGRRSLFGTAMVVATVAAAPVIPVTPTSPDAQLTAIGREALPLLREYDRLNQVWFTLDHDDPEVDRVGDASDAIYDRLSVLRDQAQDLPAASLAGAAAQAVFLRLDMLIECSRKSGMAFDGTAQERLWTFLGELTQTGAA